MRHAYLSIALLAALAPLTAGANEPDIVVEEAWLAVGGDAVSEAYLVIANRGSGFADLTGFATPIATRVRLLNGRNEELAAGTAIPTHAELYMMPQGIRLELSGLRRRPAVGEQVEISFRVADGAAVTTLATVLPPGTPPPDHHDFAHR